MVVYPGARVSIRPRNYLMIGDLLPVVLNPGIICKMDTQRK